MNKIAIIGSGGSGKSTLARQMGKKRNIPVWHLDRLLWKPNWTPTTKEEQVTIQTTLVKGEQWIIDGNYNGTMALRLEAADTIIFLDQSRWICSYRVFKRMVTYRNRTRPDMKEGCTERLNLTFLKWIWDYPKKKKPMVLAKLEQLPKDKNIIILRTRQEVKRFLEST
ncbi:DNA topology modulation protein [Bacillus sp. RAR_GA_16]|uniref:DNA topology modulation protein n=1 Tax=Bacillus sp. RAR_GA_16 TaxID=2876774 RepID=UPI001CCC3999|nr:DNA topology modulation protein [Bacillus sp. RAR_GA_16]MCA0173982.1 DNA topology modulation protein [Bacillus sp. RAR_GA_16]